MKCLNCNQNLNFPEAVLKQLSTCPYCNALLNNQEVTSAKPNFGMFLKQLVADYDTEIFLKENIGKLRREVKALSMQNEAKALMELVFSDAFKPLLDNSDSDISSLKKTLGEQIKEISSRTKISLNDLGEAFNAVCPVIGYPIILAPAEDVNYTIPSPAQQPVGENVQTVIDGKEKKSPAIPKNAMAYIARVDGLKSICNANRVEIAVVAGKQVVVGKGDFNVGDKVLYVKPDTYVNSNIQCFDFLKACNYQVLQRKIRGVLSEGVVVLASDAGFSDRNFGEDVSSLVENKNAFTIPNDASAYVDRIDGFCSIPNADKVVVASVSGKNVVVGKDEFEIGERVLYVKPGTCVNPQLQCFKFLASRNYLVSKTKIRGVQSNGIIVKLSEVGLAEKPLGFDASDIVIDSQNEEVADNEDVMDNQDIRHWKEDKFYKNVYSSKKFKNADYETKQSIRRMAKEEAKMIKGLRKDAGLDSGCYITTAVCEELGLPDDCYELTTLRSFRDNWLAKQPGGETLIKEYYATAPGIVKSIDSLKNRTDVYRFINEKFITKCMLFIESNQLNDCKMTYIKMVNYLKDLVK